MHARDAGVNEFVVKPFSTNTLYAKIRATVEHPRAFVELPDGYLGPDRRRRSIPVAEQRRGVIHRTPSSPPDGGTTADAAGQPDRTG
jgi:DNA-binding response OmpR family regulator